MRLYHLCFLVTDIEEALKNFRSNGAIILPGVTVWEGAIVAAGSVVSRDVPSYTMVGETRRGQSNNGRSLERKKAVNQLFNLFFWKTANVKRGYYGTSFIVWLSLPFVP